MSGKVTDKYIASDITRDTELAAAIAAIGKKSAIVAGTSFAGNPKKYTVTFTTAYPDANYSIAIDGEPSRSWTFESKTAAGFVINANANLAFTTEVTWTTVKTGE